MQLQSAITTLENHTLKGVVTPDGLLVIRPRFSGRTSDPYYETMTTIPIVNGTFVNRAEVLSAIFDD